MYPRKFALKHRVNDRKANVNYSYTRGDWMRFQNKVKTRREDLSVQSQNQGGPPITQEDLAASVNCTRVMINKIERGISQPGVKLALKISRALGSDPFELFPVEPTEKPFTKSEIGQPKPLDPELAEIAMLFGHKTPVYRS